MRRGKTKRRRRKEPELRAGNAIREKAVLREADDVALRETDDTALPGDH